MKWVTVVYIILAAYSKNTITVHGESIHSYFTDVINYSFVTDVLVGLDYSYSLFVASSRSSHNLCNLGKGSLQ